MVAPSGYKHFNYHIRDWLSILIRRGLSHREIGRILNKHHTTISREIKRNSVLIHGEEKYISHLAHDKYLLRVQKSRKCKIEKYMHLETYIYNKLKQSWSPEIISFKIKKLTKGISISHEAIYQYIYTRKREWLPLLAHGMKRYRRRSKYKKRSNVPVPNREFIDKRPKHINKRLEFGHYEVDTMVSRKSKEAILVILERKTRLIKLRKLVRKTAKDTSAGIINALQHYKNSVKTITYDNGSENAFHE